MVKFNYRDKYPDRAKKAYGKYYEENKEKILADNKKYRERNIDKIKKKVKEKRELKKWVKSEEDIELENIMRDNRKRESFKKYVENSKNINYRLSHRLRNRMRYAIKKSQ